MNIEVVGQGPALIYLHGWGFQPQVWNRQVEFFRSRYRNVVVDYNLEQVPEGLTHESLLETLCGQFQTAMQGRLAADERPKAIIAQGLGSFIGYELIERGWDPECLVLAGGLVRFTNDGAYMSGQSPERAAAMRKALHDDPKQMLRQYHRLAAGGTDSPLPAELAQGLPFNALEFLTLAFDTLLSHDYLDFIPKLPCRALVVQGENDKLSPVWQGELLRKLLRRSSLFLCREAGHLAFLTHYAEINRRIEQFLDEAG